MKIYRLLLVASFIMALSIGLSFTTSQELKVGETLPLALENVFWEHFSKIILNNLGVALLIVIGGFFTGGILSCLILFVNGMSLGIILSQLLSVDLPILLKLKLIAFHTPIEFLAFFLFADIAEKGFFFMKNLWKKEEFNLIHTPKIKDFYLPTTLLFLAAVIEVLIIYTI